MLDHVGSNQILLLLKDAVALKSCCPRPCSRYEHMLVVAMHLALSFVVYV
jgi:hypothetical protein